MAEMLDAMDASWEAGKTPLLIDRTSEDSSSMSPLESFYAHRSHMLIELKKMVVEVNRKKTVTLEEAREQARRKIVLAMHRGYNVVLLCANSAPPLTSKFCSEDELPLELLDCEKIGSSRSAVSKRKPTGRRRGPGNCLARMTRTPSTLCTRTLPPWS